MKKRVRHYLAGFAALALALFFAMIFIRYAQPMDNQMYDLSTVIELNEVEVADTCEELGWSVYTQEGDVVTPLIHDGLGCFEGLAELGQTFYFSRVMQEALDAPTIQLGSANRNFSVFLDGVLIYTDCPEQDNRIGYLTLPMREWDRKENVTVSLPEDYVGKTLTIAQSTPLYAETPRMATRVIPTSVKLYCAYAYESGLIAESFQTACIGAVCYAFGVMMLVIFILRLLHGTFDWGILFLALAVFLSMTVLIYDTSYYIQYFGIPRILSGSGMCQTLMIAAMLAFLSTQAPRLRGVFWGLTAMYAAAVLLFVALAPRYAAGVGAIGRLVWDLPDFLSSLCIPIILVLSWFLRRRSEFFRYFAPLSAAAVLLYAALQLILPTRGEFIISLSQSLRGPAPKKLLYFVYVMMMLVSMGIIEVQTLRREITRHTEKQLMLEMSRMSQQRYDNLRAHNEEVMMLRHDMKRHFQVLRQTTTDEKTAAYLDELLDKNDHIRPVIQSGNDMLDTILCGRLNAAMDAGIRVEIIRAAAPEKLPVTDADLCSLMMNLIDNAIAAAATAEHPLIRLDLHQKSDFFVFVCENSMGAETHEAKTEKTVPKHGLGLKIVRQIAERYGHLLTMEADGNTYRVSLAIPLPQPAR